MKKRLLKILAISFLIAISSNGFAQNYIMGIGDYIDYANIKRTNSPNVHPYSDIQGSPYLNKEFSTGQIKLKDGKIYQGPLRYDMYADQIEFRTEEGDVYSVANPEAIELVTIDDKNFLSFKKTRNELMNGIVELLVDGEYTLMAKHIVELKDPVAAKPYVEAKPARFVQKGPDYYIIDPIGSTISVSNKKDLYAINTNKAGLIKKFVKDKKIKYNVTEDLIKLVNYLNGLNE